MVIEVKGMRVTGEIKAGYEEILTKEALEFIERIEGHFGERRIELLKRRVSVQEEINQGKLPDFLKETQSYSRWRIGRLLHSRRPSGSTSRNYWAS